MEEIKRDFNKCSIILSYDQTARRMDQNTKKETFKFFLVHNQMPIIKRSPNSSFLSYADEQQ